MADDINITVAEQPIVIQFSNQGMQGVTGATGPQGKDGDVWELRLTMTGAPDGTLTMELFRNGGLCEDQHYASVMYMTNDGTGYEQSDEWSKNFTGTYSFTYTGMRSFFITVYDDAFKEKIICHNSVNYGKAATIEIGNVEHGQTASVTNVGNVYNAILDFVLPKGDTATVQVGTVTTLPAGSRATVVNVGTPNDAILDFGIPNGGGSGARVEENEEGNNIILDAGAIYVPSVSSDGVISWTNNASLVNPQSVRVSINPKGQWSSSATYLRFDTVLYNGSSYMALKDVAAGTMPTNAAFWVQLVAKGDSGTITIGTVTTGEPGADASVTNVGTQSDAILDFVIPEGEKGEQGDAGTITIGTVTTLPEGTNASIENVGTPENAILNIGIPRGDTGHFDAEFISDYFDIETSYDVGDYVIYNNDLYKFTTAHPAGSWNANHVEQVVVTEEIKGKADSAAVAQEFEPFKSYNFNDFVMYNGRLYQFVASHGSGLWNANEVTQITYTAFDSTEDYSVGDYVQHDGKMYQFTSAHGGSVWDDDDVEELTITPFATGTAYAVNDYVTYEGNLYKFISAHTDGAWGANEADVLSIEAFDTDNSYSTGDYVTYDDKLYQFTADHENGDWDANDVTIITPTAFATDTDYAAGNYVTYDGGLYQFTSAHEGGAWDSDYVEEIQFTEFAESTGYADGDCVKYNNNYYIFKVPHTSGAWNASEVTPIATSAFSTGTEYLIGEYVTYNGGYYRFKEDHTDGAWNTDEVRSITVESFANGVSYPIGTYVLKDGDYYQFTAVHPDGAWNESEVINMNATEFSAEENYFIGNYVYYDGNYYCFTTFHGADVWDANDVSLITADAFNQTDNYHVGDYVINNGDLFIFTTNHTGSAWNTSEVDEITVRTFNGFDSYSINDYVSWNDNYYQFTTNHAGSSWDASQVDEIDADAFSTVEDYVRNDYAVHGGDLYKFTSDHTGSSWNAQEVNEITVDTYSTTTDYAIGDYAIYDNGLYRFTAQKQGGAWRIDETSEISYSAFSDDANYAAGDYVEYNNVIYQFTGAHTNGHWNPSEVTEIEYVVFDDTEDYTIGDYVEYNGDVYQFTDNHTGSAWNESEVTGITYDEFTTLADYEAGDYVEYNGSVYVFTVNHEGGAFDDSETSLLSVEEFGDGHYVVGDYVWHDGNLYQFTSAHTGSEWNPSEVEERAVMDMQAGSGIITDEFDETVVYNEGDYCLYQGLLYRFNTEHTGPWSASDAVSVTVCDELSGSGVTARYDENDECITFSLSAESVGTLAFCDTELIADYFDETKSYSIGDYCMYEHGLYRFTSAHTAGDWDTNDVVEVKVSDEFGNGSGSGGSGGSSQGATAEYDDEHEGIIFVEAPPDGCGTLAYSDADILADEFDETASYSVGDYCMYESGLYKFVHAHSAGEWDSTEVTAVSLSDELKRIAEAAASSATTPEMGIGDIITFDGNTMVITTAQNSISDLQKLTAPLFSQLSNYSIGDYVIHDNKLYKFTADHVAGAWDASEATAVNVAEELIELRENGGGGGAPAEHTHDDRYYTETEIDTMLDDKADIITVNKSDGIVRIEDGTAQPVVDLSVGIEPVQNLHGYDKPWPAGGGKNKFNWEDIGNYDFSVSNGIFTNTIVDTREKFVFQLQAYNENTYLKNTGTLYCNYTGQYSFTNTQIPENTTRIKLKHGGQTKDLIIGFVPVDIVSVPFTVSFTVTSNDPTTVGGLVISDIQLEEGSTATDYAPCSNICPITGWTGANVMRTGKNLLPKLLSAEEMHETRFSITSDGDSVTLNDTVTGTDGVASRRITDYFFIKAGTYILSGNNPIGFPAQDNAYIQIRFVDTTPAALPNEYRLTLSQINASKVMTFTSDIYTRLEVRVYKDMVFDNFVIKPTLCLVPESDTTFESSQFITYPISWESEAGTVYGGSLDVTTGILTVTHEKIQMDGVTPLKMVDAKGSGSNNYYYNLPSASLEGRTEIGFYSGSILRQLGCKCSHLITCDRAESAIGFGAYLGDQGRTFQPRFYFPDDYPDIQNIEDCNQWFADMLEAGTPVEFTYKLKEPITYQLTPTEVTTILGSNRIWADTGDVDVTYFRNTAIGKTIANINDNISTLQNSKAENDIIAAEFDTETSYEMGDIVMHEGALYRFATAHEAGEWDAEEVLAMTIGEELKGAPISFMYDAEREALIFVSESQESVDTDNVIYGFRIDSGESDPSDAVTYLADAVNMTPAYMDFANGRFNYGSWSDAFFMPKPCMLKFDGTVDYYLDPNDYTKKEDGTPSDVADDTYGGNAMMEWGQNGKKIWYKIAPDLVDYTSGTVLIANYQADEDYKAWSFINNQGDMVDHFYTPIYNGWLDGSSRLRSLSGKSPTVSLTATQERTAARANNTTDAIWDTEVYCDITIINLLLTLISKSLDSQGVFGNGNITGSNESAILTTGLGDAAGLFYGSSANNQVVKVFGMENWWGNYYRRFAGLANDKGENRYKLTRGTEDGSSVSDYIISETAGDYSGYLKGRNLPAMGTSGSYLKYFSFAPNIISPFATGGTATTYSCDYLYCNQNTVGYALRGGRLGNSTQCGLWCMTFNDVASTANWKDGACISCKPLSQA